MLAEKSMKVGHKMYQCVSIKAALARGHQQKCTLLVTVLKDAHHDGTCRLLPDTSEENFCKAYRPCQFLTSCLMTDLFFFFFFLNPLLCVSGYRTPRGTSVMYMISMRSV